MKSTYDAYYEAPQAMKDIVDSGIIGDLVQSILIETEFLSLKAKVIVSSTKFFLSAITIDEFALELRSFNIDEPLIQTLLTENKRLLEGSLHEISQSMNSVSDEIAKLEKALEPNIESTYTSTQAAILEEGRSAQVTPAPKTETQKPQGRWETEQ